MSDVEPIVTPDAPDPGFPEHEPQGPTWDLDAEAIVLAALFDHPVLLDLVRSRVELSDFAARPNWCLYQAICAVADVGQEISPPTVWTWIDKNDRVGDLANGRGGAMRYVQ